MRDSQYHWQTNIFRGDTAGEATKSFDAWINASPLETISQPILRTAHGMPFWFISHHPFTDHYEIHVTALMASETPED
jgi:hypothetical protein